MARKPDAKRARIGARVHDETRTAVERIARREHLTMSTATELLIEYGWRNMPKGWRP